MKGNEMNYNNLTAKAAVFEGAGKPFSVREFPLTQPGVGEALLRLRVSGVCGTDVHIHRGRLGQPSPLIIGHEFIGEIADIDPANTEFKVGDRVIYNMARPCGECLLCRTGDSANCLSFDVAYARNPEKPPHFFGGYAEYVYSRADCAALIKLPDGVDDLAAALFPCAGPTVIHALKLGGVFADRAEGVETAVVQGAGPLGLFSCLWLTMAGVKNIIVTAKNIGSDRVKFICENTDAKACSATELDERVARGMTADLAIECSGAPEAFAAGCAMLRNRGIYLVPGQYSDSGTIPFGPQVITFKALQIIGSSQYDAGDVADYSAFLADNRERLNALAPSVKTYRIDDINEAMSVAAAHRYTKVALIR